MSMQQTPRIVPSERRWQRKRESHIECLDNRRCTALRTNNKLLNRSGSLPFSPFPMWCEIKNHVMWNTKIMGPFLCVRTALRLLIMCGILPRYKTLNNVYKEDNTFMLRQPIRSKFYHYSLKTVWLYVYKSMLYWYIIMNSFFSILKNALRQY